MTDPDTSSGPHEVEGAMPGPGRPSARRWLLALLVAMVVGVGWMLLHRDSGPATLVMDDFEFRPDVLRLRAAEPGQELLISNVSSDNVHDFTVVGLPEDVPVHIALFEDTLDVPYVLPGIPAGTYVIYCSVPGHRIAGMESTMVVE